MPTIALRDCFADLNDNNSYAEEQENQQPNNFAEEFTATARAIAEEPLEDQSNTQLAEVDTVDSVVVPVDIAEDGEDLVVSSPRIAEDRTSPDAPPAGINGPMVRQSTRPSSATRRAVTVPKAPVLRSGSRGRERVLSSEERAVADAAEGQQAIREVCARKPRSAV